MKGSVDWALHEVKCWSGETFGRMLQRATAVGTVQGNRFAWIIENRFPWFGERVRRGQCDRGRCLPPVDGPASQESACLLYTSDAADE